MGIIRQLPDIIDEASRRAELTVPHRFDLTEEWDPAKLGFNQLTMDLKALQESPDEQSNWEDERDQTFWSQSADHSIYFGDNLRLMKYLQGRRDIAGKINMIYIDPPFFTKADYDAVLNVGGRKVRHPAYEDTWHSGMREYLTQLAESIILLKSLLAEDGTVWIHLDWHATHYARVLLDEIFGPEHFVNEIIWEYKSGGSTTKRFARKHDNILVYSKGLKHKFHPLKEKSYNRGFKPYHFKGVQEYQDEIGWYTMVNMKDVWKIDMVGRTSAERTGYATQKPELLLRRIIQSCTDPGDLVADFFCGSGTTGVVAGQLGRRSISCDRAGLAIEKTLERFCSKGIGSSLYMEGSAYFEDELIPDDPRAGNLWSNATVNQILMRELQNMGDPTQPAVSVNVKQDGNRIWIDSVELDPDQTKLDKKSREELAEALEANPFDVIEAWSVDECFDGEVFRPRQLLARNKKGLDFSAELHDGAGRIVVKVVTMMGNTEYIML